MTSMKNTRVQVILTETQDIYLKQCVRLYDGDQNSFIKALFSEKGSELVNENRNLRGLKKMSKKDIQNVNIR